MVGRGARLAGSLAVVLWLATAPGATAAGSKAAADSPDDAASMRELSDRVSALESLLGRTRLGAWIDFLYLDSDKAGSDPFFDPQHFYLYLDNRVNEKWQAFAELEFEHSPKLTGQGGAGEVKLERLYIQHNVDDLLHVRMGRFNTQWGYWTPIHWAINVDTIQSPIHEDNQYVPPKSVGLEAHGSWFPVLSHDTDIEIRYSGFFTNGSESFGTNQPRDGSFGGGGDLRLLYDERYLLGFSLYQQRNPAPRLGTPGRLEQGVAIYTDLKLTSHLTLRGEYMHQRRSRGDPDVRVWYAKARLDFLGKAYLNYRFNSGDDDRRGLGGRHRVHTITLGYWPLPEVRFKLEFNRNAFRNLALEDFDSWGLFVGYIF